jgi:hypothetical protein
MFLLEAAAASVAHRFHARVENQDVETVFVTVHKFIQVMAHLPQLALGEPALEHRFLPAHLVTGEIFAYPVQAPGVADVIGNKIEGTGHEVIVDNDTFLV